MRLPRLCVKSPLDKDTSQSCCVRGHLLPSPRLAIAVKTLFPVRSHSEVLGGGHRCVSIEGRSPLPPARPLSHPDPLHLQLGAQSPAPARRSALSGREQPGTPGDTACHSAPNFVPVLSSRWPCLAPPASGAATPVFSAAALPALGVPQTAQLSSDTRSPASGACDRPLGRTEEGQECKTAVPRGP